MTALDDSIIIVVISISISISIHGCRIFYPSNGCLRHTMDDSGLSPPFGTAARGHEHRPGLSCGPGIISQVIPSTSAL